MSPKEKLRVHSCSCMFVLGLDGMVNMEHFGAGVTDVMEGRLESEASCVSGVMGSEGSCWYWTWSDGVSTVKQMRGGCAMSTLVTVKLHGSILT